MGTGVSDRTVLFSNLGAMYGMLIFFSTSLERALKDGGARLSDDEKALLSDANEGVSKAVDRSEKLHRTLDGDELKSFVAGLAEVTRCVIDDIRRDLGDRKQKP